MAESVGDGQEEHWLLLLPLLNSEITSNSLRVAYGPSLTAALRDASKVSLDRSRPTVLDVAVGFHSYVDASFSRLQRFFAQLYNLTCVLCVEEKIDISFDNDVDVRIALFNASDAKNGFDTGDPQGDGNTLENLTQARRQWQRVYTVESGAGLPLYNQFRDLRSHSSSGSLATPEAHHVPGGLWLRDTGTQASSATIEKDSTTLRHTSVAVGGTFDHLHAGHKLLLTMTILVVLRTALAKKSRSPWSLIIGITGDPLLKKKDYFDELESWDTRKDNVQAFIHDFLRTILPQYDPAKSKYQSRVESKHKTREVIETLESGSKIRYAELLDPFGPTITDQCVTALVISTETRGGGEAVNQRRWDLYWPPLEIFEVGIVNAQSGKEGGSDDNLQKDIEGKLSSTEIRARVNQKLQKGKG